jgi:hypothetical protein
MTKLEKLQKDRIDLIEQILAFVPTKDRKITRLRLDLLHNLGAREVLEKLDYEPKSN